MVWLCSAVREALPPCSVLHQPPYAGQTTGPCVQLGVFIMGTSGRALFPEHCTSRCCAGMESPRKSSCSADAVCDPDHSSCKASQILKCHQAEKEPNAKRTLLPTLQVMFYVSVKDLAGCSGPWARSCSIRVLHKRFHRERKSKLQQPVLLVYWLYFSHITS